jgi:hypothetical protein
LEGSFVSACLDFEERPGDLPFAIAWARSLPALAPGGRGGALAGVTGHVFADMWLRAVVSGDLERWHPAASLDDLVRVVHDLTVDSNPADEFSRLPRS